METIKYTSEIKVSEQHTAERLGSGDMKVLATPAMIALMENAAMNAAKATHGEEQATVGTFISTTHERATPLGADVRAEAELVEQDVRKLRFIVKAYDSQGLIGQGEHERFIVDRTKFLSRIYPGE